MNYLILVIVLTGIAQIFIHIKSKMENRRLKNIISLMRYEKRCPVENSPDFKDCQCCSYCSISKTFNKVKK